MIRASFGKSVARSTLIGGLALLAIPAVAGCEAGLNAPTLEYHAASAGAQKDFNGISLANVFVLAAPSGSSVPAGGSASLFVGLYNGNGASDTLDSVSTPAASSVTIKGGSVTIPAAGAANLTGPEPVVVLKDLANPISGGQTIPVSFTFAHAGTVTLDVPVEPQSSYYSTYSPPAALTATSTPSPSGKATGKAKANPSSSASATPSSSTSPSASVTPTPTTSS